MKKRVLLFIGIGVLILLAVLFSVWLFARPTGHTAPAPTNTVEAKAAIPTGTPGEVVFIPFTEKISVDGDLSDWKDIPSTTVNTGPTPSKDPAEDGSFAFQLAADADNLYINMQAVDKNIIAGKHGTDFWNEDSMEFFINASDNLNTRIYNPKIFQININAADIGNKDPMLSPSPESTAKAIRSAGSFLKLPTAGGLKQPFL
jgi:hypothetical protein